MRSFRAGATCSLLAADLVDEHRLWICPVVPGKGRRLFAPGLPPSRFKLISSLSPSTGVLLNTYRPNRSPAKRQSR